MKRSPTQVVTMDDGWVKIVQPDGKPPYYHHPKTNVRPALWEYSHIGTVYWECVRVPVGNGIYALIR